MISERDSLGIIAGNRSLPLIFAKEARRQGIRRLVAVGFEGETDPALASLVDELVWIKVGQLSKMIAAFTDRGIQRCVMAGQVAPKNLYELRPDLRALAMLLRNDDQAKRERVVKAIVTAWPQPVPPSAVSR